MKRVFPILLAIGIAMGILLTGCGGSSVSYDSMNGISSPSESMGGGFDSSESWSDTNAKVDGETQESGQKLIKTAWLDIETTSFEESVSGITSLMEDLSGYFENRVISNYNSGARSASLTIRIPASNYTEFLSKAGTLGHITRQEDTQEDISESYYDTAGRLETQKIKLERLQNLLKDAERMEDIITIESAISETEQAIDYLSGTIRHYDGKVDYATVYISLDEVYRLSNVEEVPETFFDRFSSSFKNGMNDFADDLEDFAVYMAYAWLRWLIAIAIIVIIIKVIRKIMLSHKSPNLPTNQFKMKKKNIHANNIENPTVSGNNGKADEPSEQKHTC